MSSENDTSPKDDIIDFDVTKKMKQAGISQFFIKNNDFMIIFEDGGMRCIHFDSKSRSIGKIIDKIHQKLKKEPLYNYLKNALQDIEAELIKKSDKIFSSNDKESSNYNSENKKYKTAYITEVTNLRKQHIESTLIGQKYEKLAAIVQKNFPGAWSLLEYCLAIKTILNIEGCSLPFIGVLLDVPSSLKTLVIELFRKYPYSFYSDSFTPNSLISHNSALNEEQLQKVDMIPKIRNKLVLIPEMASIFTAKEDDLRKMLGHITRLADGHGLESDSGAQGHRKYGNTFFVWIGAAVEIPPRVWKLLGTLGHKIYFFRAVRSETTEQELLEIIKLDNFTKKQQEVENALYDYLITLEAFPDKLNAKISSDGITKIKWDNNTDEQECAIVWITKLSMLLAHLRGSVYLSPTRHYHTHNKDYIKKETETASETKSSPAPYVEELDYDNGIPIIEKPTRAATMLRNLAIGHAFSQGRDTISSKDLPMLIRVVLSTTMIGRSKVFELLVEKEGELYTSTICKELGVSMPTAKRAMRELCALKLVDISSGYNISELKITLNEKFEWLKSSEFKALRNNLPYHSENNEDTETHQKNHQIKTSVAESSEDSATKNIEQFIESDSPMQERCDLKSGHMPKVNSPPETRIKNIDMEMDSGNSNGSKYNFNADRNCTENYKDSRLSESRSDNIKESEVTQLSSNICDSKLKSEEKNNVPLWGSNCFQHVTVTRSQTHEISGTSDDSGIHHITKKEILEIIRETNGSISFNAAIQSACSRNQSVKNYLGDKLTSRENKKIRKLSEIIHNENIEVIKTRPQIILKWIDAIKNEKYPSEII